MARKFRKEEPALPSDIVRLNNRLASGGVTPEARDEPRFYPRSPDDEAQDRFLLARSQRDDMA